MAMRYYAPLPGGGDPGPPRRPHALRVGDAERDTAAADLGEHYVAGRLTLDELHERLEAVFAAKTYGQLTRVMADLPGLRRLPWVTVPGWPAPPAPGPPPRRPEPTMTATDRAGRLAALSLLLLAMLIWLFTALIFARHGFYHPTGPPVPPHPFGPLGPR